MVACVHAPNPPNAKNAAIFADLGQKADMKRAHCDRRR
jgi:hypothetical protein